MNAKEQLKRDLVKAQIRKMVTDDPVGKIEAEREVRDLRGSLRFLERLYARPVNTACLEV